MTIEKRSIVMIIDSDFEANTLITGTLQLSGFKAFKVVNAEEAIKKLNEDHGGFDAVILVGDIAMTQGGMLISKIKQINPSIQILVVAERHSDKAKVLEYGADEFTIKPVSSETVVNKLIAMLEQGKATDKSLA